MSKYLHPTITAEFQIFRSYFHNTTQKQSHRHNPRISSTTTSTIMPRETGPDVEQGRQHFRTPTKGGSNARSSSRPAEISPSDTFDTALTSPSTFDSADSPGYPPQKPQKVSFEHNIKTSSKKSGGSFIFGLSKPILGLTILFLVAAAAGKLH